MRERSAFPWLPIATIHWSGTVVFDDPDGKRFAKVREGFHKWLLRRGIVWVDVRVVSECKAHTDIVHCHLLFHLPVEYRTGGRFLQVEAALFATRRSPRSAAYWAETPST